MRRKFLRRDSKAARWSPRLGVVALLALLGAVITQYFVEIDVRVLAAFLAFCSLVAFGGLLAALRGFVDLWRHGDRGGHKSIKGLLLSLLTLVSTLSIPFLWFTMPPLYDIATDVENPPPFFATARPATARPVYLSLVNQAEEQRAAWPNLSGRRYDGAPDRILTAVETVLEEAGWQLVARQGTLSEDNDILVAAQAAPWFIRLDHDVVIRLSDEGDTTFVDMRATARSLPRDFGLGAYYILSFMDALDRAVLLAPQQVEE